MSSILRVGGVARLAAQRSLRSGRWASVTHTYSHQADKDFFKVLDSKLATMSAAASKVERTVEPIDFAAWKKVVSPAVVDQIESEYKSYSFPKVSISEDAARFEQYLQDFQVLHAADLKAQGNKGEQLADELEYAKDWKAGMDYMHVQDVMDTPGVDGLAEQQLTEVSQQYISDSRDQQQANLLDPVAILKNLNAGNVVDPGEMPNGNWGKLNMRESFAEAKGALGETQSKYNTAMVKFLTGSA
jgi:hypothetical protein